MIHDPLSVEKALAVLNEMVDADPVAARALVEARVPCNDELAHHATIQVQGDKQPDGSLRCSVGFLGALNGLFGTDDAGWGPIAAEFAVVCLNDDCLATVRDIGDRVVGEKCPGCGQPLQLGALLGFHRAAHSKGS